MQNHNKDEQCLGCRIDAHKLPKLRPDLLLFGESQSRVIVTCKAENVKDVFSEGKKEKIDIAEIGIVTDDGRIRISDIVDISVTEVLDGYNNSIKRQMQTAG
jgi:phosphoribosylformylglycinamidine (FGAM) synthase-like enzyme